MKKPAKEIRTNEQRQEARRQAVIKGAKAVRKTEKDVGEGWRLLGEHVANKFVNFMWDNVFIAPKIDKSRYANNDTE